MTPDSLPPLPPIALSEGAMQRIRTRTRAEARRVRLAAAEAAVHGAFAIGALAWAAAALFA